MEIAENLVVVKFPEEERILVADCGKLLFVYEYKYKIWREENENLSITIQNYPDVTKEELVRLTKGVLPKSREDFERLCKPSFLSVNSMMRILEEDYPDYVFKRYDEELGFAIGDTIYMMVRTFLEESEYLGESYGKIRSLLDKAVGNQFDRKQIEDEICELSNMILGRKVVENQILILDEKDHSYNWIGPERIIEIPDKGGIEYVGSKGDYTISLDIDTYLYPFLVCYFDDELLPNKWREKGQWEDDSGVKHLTYYKGFQSYCESNHYTLDAFERILEDINDTIDALSTGRTNRYVDQISGVSGLDAKEKERIIDFYQRFIFRMKYMLGICKEKGFNYIFVSYP